MIRFALDSQLFIQAIRDDGWRDDLLEFYSRAGWFTWLSAVVAQEVLAGAGRRDAPDPEDGLLRPYVERGLVFAPSFSAWKRSGEVIAALSRNRRIDRDALNKAFANDILIAASCAEQGVTLVTRNTRDFSLIAEEIPFAFVEPWP